MKANKFSMRVAKTVHDITLSREALIFSVLFTALTLLWLSPATKLQFYKTLLADITQDRILAEVNPHRATIGVQPLTINQKLGEAARLKAEDMLARDYFSHFSPEGEKPWVWYSRVGYQYAAAGENLAIDFSDPIPLINAWLASPTHAANIENGTFTDMGIGVASGDFQGRNTIIVVMFLGKPMASTLATTTPQPTPPPQPVSQPPPPQTPQPPLPESPPPTQVPPPPPTEEFQPPPEESPARTETETTHDSDLEPPLVTENVPSQETFITVKEPPNGALDTNAPVPARTTLLEFLLLKAAATFRWFLSAAFGTTMAASAVLYAAPAHRKLVNRSGIFTLTLLLGILWMPNLL